MASSLVLSRKKEGNSSTERTGPGFSAFKASADRPAQKNATSDVISSQPIACPSYLIMKLVTCCHRPGRSEVRSSDYSPCFADPALLSVVGFLHTVKLPVKYHTRARPLTSSPISQSRALPTSRLVT